MSASVLAAVALLGGVGAVGRFLLDAAVGRRLGRRFPFGTLTVNLAGAAALGVLSGAGVGGIALILVAVGLLGSFTTFSTWAYESHRLHEDGRTGLGTANLVLSLALGLAAVWLGRVVGAVLV